jgi:hypothetical protein
MSEYLRAVQPIVSSQQFEKTERIVKQLITNPGPQLYQYLLDKRDAEDNWVRRKSLLNYLVNIFIIFLINIKNEKRANNTQSYSN